MWKVHHLSERGRRLRLAPFYWGRWRRRYSANGVNCAIRPSGLWGMMRELYDADIWQLKKAFRRTMVAASVAALVILALSATDF